MNEIRDVKNNKPIRLMVYITEEERNKLTSIAVFNKTPPRDCISLLINRAYETDKLRYVLSKLEKEEPSFDVDKF